MPRTYRRLTRPRAPAAALSSSNGAPDLVDPGGGAVPCAVTVPIESAGVRFAIEKRRLSIHDEHAEFPERMLAVAVIQRAVQDLAIPSDTERGEALDAARFLLERLWGPADLWGRLICPLLRRDIVAETVTQWISPDVRRALPRRLRRLLEV